MENPFPPFDPDGDEPKEAPTEETAVRLRDCLKCVRLAGLQL